MSDKSNVLNFPNNKRKVSKSLISSGMFYLMGYYAFYGLLNVLFIGLLCLSMTA